MDNGHIIYSASLNEMSNKDLSELVKEMCVNIFEEYHPGEYYPKSSVSVGEFYSTNYGKSCQVRFKKNGVIMRVSYFYQTGLFDCEFYQLSHIRKVVYGRMDDDIDNSIYINTKDNIEDFQVPTPPKPKQPKESKLSKPKKRVMKKTRRSKL